MRSSWECYICNNIFYFINNDERLGFMINHSTSCCKVLYSNGMTAYVGPASYVNKQINDIVTMSGNNNLQDYNVNNIVTKPVTSDMDLNSYKDTKGWITIPERIGYATAKILVVLRDFYDVVLEEELTSLRYKDHQAFMTELDREKAVKIYFTRNNLVDTVNRKVRIDELFYSILLLDDKILRSFYQIKCENGKRQYFMDTNSRNMYARQIACSLRRLDRYDTRLTNITL